MSSFTPKELSAFVAQLPEDAEVTTMLRALDARTLGEAAARFAISRNTAERLLVRVVETIWLKRTWRAFRMPDAYEFSTVASTRAKCDPILASQGMCPGN